VDSSPSGFHELPKKQLIGTIIGLQLTLLLAALDQTIVSTAMPKIIEHLSGFDRYAWVTTAYMLTSTAAVPIFGKLSDMYGRKWILLGGAIFFVLTSALCGMAGEFPRWFGDGMTQLIIFRGLQGIGGGVIFAMVFTVIGDIFPPAERGKYQGLFSAVFAFASVLGPTLGGWITDSLSWRWVFYVNMPVGALAIAALYFAFPYFRPDGPRHAIDYGGVISLLGFLTPLLLALTWVVKEGWTSPSVVLMLAFSAVMFCLFIAFEARANEPLVPLALFKNSIVSLSSISLVLSGIAMFGAIIFIPLFMQSVMSLSATVSGSLLTPMMLMMAVGSITSGQLVSRIGHYKRIALVGLGLMTVGMWLLSGMQESTTQLQAVGYMMTVGIGLGLTMPIYTLIVQNVAPWHMIGAATAATQFFRSIGGTLGVAIFGTVMLSNFNAYLAQHPHAIKPALVYSLDSIFLIGAILTAVTFILNVFLKEVPLRKTHGPTMAPPVEQATLT
jgi:EmrB/QacA subfamily drug resistance transporter